MIKIKLFFLFSSSLLLLNCSLAAAQQIDTIRLTQKLPVLNKRAFLKFPAKAANVARSNGIMSADPNQDVETRVILDIGKMRLVFFAHELYKFSNGDFVNDVKTSPTDENKKQEILLNKNNMLAVLSTPVAFDSTKSAMLINSLLVKTKDNTVFRIDAYINPAAFGQRNDFIKLAGKVFATLQIGPRLNKRIQREQTVNIWGTKSDFKLAIPNNYCVSVDRAYDFQVIRFHKYSQYSDTSWVNFFIYTGNYPWADYSHYGFELDSAVNVTGKFLAKPVTWMIFKNEAKSIFIKEKKIPLDNVREGLLVHIGVVGNNSECINESNSIIETIRLEVH